MAAAEARTVWHRVANRYIVQEDAKRAPKLACCPSSSSKLQYDSEGGEGDNGACNPALNHMPVNWSPMNPNMSPDMKWWLQLQPDFGHQKDFIYEKLNKIESELENKKTENVISPSKVSGELLSDVKTDVEFDENAGSFTESPLLVSTTIRKRDFENKVEETKTVKSGVQLPLTHKVNPSDLWYGGDEFMDWKVVDQLVSTVPDEASFDMEPYWEGGKNEPWWLVKDKDELALLVAQKSSEHIENCDLPPPQKMRVSKDQFACIGKFDDAMRLSSSLDSNLHSGKYKGLGHAWCSSTLETTEGMCMSYNEVGHPLYYSEKLHRNTHSHDSIAKNFQGKIHASDNNPGKAELLQALCHSQTRAREAEIAAQKAYNEKEHVIKLFFKQASHLFAYKQWLRLLQLESLCLQLKIKEYHLSTLFPAMPWMPEREDWTERDGQKKGAKKKGKKRKKCSFCGHLIAFAVGMSLASAGLLLGWTLGCLLPMI